VWDRPPLEPVIVSVYLLVTVEELAEMVRVEPPEPNTTGGLKLAVVPAGNPLTLRFTDPVKPALATTRTP
jgi:hypothetical protein